MYTLNLNRVPENGALKENDLELSLAELELGPPFLAPGVRGHMELQRMFGKVYGRIHAEALAELDCGRCLKPFKADIRADFAIQFEPRDGVRDDGADEDDAGPSMAFYDGDILPVGEEIRQELELQIPFAPQCKKDCKGLCPRCGQDLNLGDCGCPRNEEGGAFAALNDLLKKQEP